VRKAPGNKQKEKQEGGKRGEVEDDLIAKEKKVEG
jgi:hypothetical protein